MKASSLVALSLATLAGVSVADSPTSRQISVPIDQGQIPQRCQQFTVVPADARTDMVVWNQKLSLAECLKPEKQYTSDGTAVGLRTLVTEINQDITPAVTVYSEAATCPCSPEQVRILANYGLAQTYLDAMGDARRAVEQQGAGAVGGSTYATNQAAYLHGSLEPMLVGHRQAAGRALNEVVRISDANPELARDNQVVAYVVTDSRQQLAELSRQGTIPQTAER